VIGSSLGQQCVDPVNRVILMTDEETFQWLGYSLDTGDLLWGPVGEGFNSYQYYGSGLGGGQIGFPAYGNLYTQGFGGEIHCYSTIDGSLLWKYNNTNSGVETPWGNYPLFIAAIADHKVYAFNNEHSPNTPLYKGERVRCIDADTGQELWTMLGWAGQSGGPGTSTSILADGTFVYYNYYDNQLYAVGRGPSKVTVEAPLTAIGNGQGVVIRGTVEDNSAGAKKLVEDGIFNIVPLASDASMGPWMEFLYMQKPCPDSANGVPVSITATHSDGTNYQIGTVTSDLSGSYAVMWTPPKEGIYTITASFDGSDSYWPSYSTTNIGVGTAPSGSVTPSEPVNPDNQIETNVYILAAVAAIIVIVATLAVVILRRRK